MTGGGGESAGEVFEFCSQRHSWGTEGLEDVLCNKIQHVQYLLYIWTYTCVCLYLWIVGLSVHIYVGMYVFIDS